MVVEGRAAEADDRGGQPSTATATGHRASRGGHHAWYCRVGCGQVETCAQPQARAFEALSVPTSNFTGALATPSYDTIDTPKAVHHGAWRSAHVVWFCVRCGRCDLEPAHKFAKCRFVRSEPSVPGVARTTCATSRDHSTSTCTPRPARDRAARASPPTAAPTDRKRNPRQPEEPMRRLRDIRRRLTNAGARRPTLRSCRCDGAAAMPDAAASTKVHGHTRDRDEVP